jgi:hypothetical protein
MPVSAAPLSAIGAVVLSAHLFLAPDPGMVTREYTPFTADGRTRQDLVVHTVAGSCWTGSLATPRADAWRCMTGNLIHDPCFSASRDARQVVCAEAPWEPKVTVMSLTEPLPLDEGNKGPAEPWWPRAWAFVLASGDRCVFLTGATDIVQGHRIDYGCERGGHALAFDSRRGTVLVQNPESKSLTTERVSESWY